MFVDKWPTSCSGEMSYSLLICHIMASTSHFSFVLSLTLHLTLIRLESLIFSFISQKKKFLFDLPYLSLLLTVCLVLFVLAPVLPSQIFTISIMRKVTIILPTSFKLLSVGANLTPKNILGKKKRQQTSLPAVQRR